MSINIDGSNIVEVAFGNEEISAIYNGPELVWKHDSYPPETVMMDSATGGTYTTHLKKGRYYIALTGAGGQTSGGYYYICGKNLGSSGGTVAGDFYVNQECDISVTIGVSSGGKSYLTVDGIEMMTANGGNTCHSINDCGNHDGGTASFNLSGKLSNKTLQAIQGNPGYYTTGNPGATASNDPIDVNRGKGAHAADCNVIAGNPGGIYIKYVSMKK